MGENIIKKPGLLANAVLALSLIFTGVAAAEQEISIIPEGAVPDQITDIYQKAGKIGKAYINRPYINTYKELYGRNIDLHKQIPAAPGSFADTVKNMTAAAAEKEALRCIAKQCFNTLPGDRLMNVIAPLEALRHNDLTTKEHVYYKAFLNGLTPSRRYQKLEQKKIKEAVTSLLNNSDFLSNLQKWLPAQYITDNNAREQYDIHQESLQLVSDEIRKAFGLGPAIIVLDNFLTMSGGLGMAFPPELTDNMTDGKQIIVIDYSANRPDQSPSGYIDTASHETKHSIDQELARQLIKGKTDQTNPHFHHIATVVLNGHAYQNGNTSPLQYTERRAEHFGRSFVKTLIKAVKSTQQQPKPIQP